MKHTIDLDALLDALAEKVAERLRPALPVRSAEGGAPYLTRKEATATFRVELKALLQAERAGALTAFRPGRRVIYRRTDLVEMVEACRLPIEVHAAPSAEVVPLDPFERAVARADRRSRIR